MTMIVIAAARAVPLLAATHAVPRVGGVKVAVAVTRKLHRRALGGRADAGGVELVHCREVPCPPGASVTLLLVVQQSTRTAGHSCTPKHPPVSLGGLLPQTDDTHANGNACARASTHLKRCPSRRRSGSHRTGGCAKCTWTPRSAHPSVQPGPHPERPLLHAAKPPRVMSKPKIPNTGYVITHTHDIYDGWPTWSSVAYLPRSRQSM